mmetsp:Transcript_18991/g.36513  ORF Transcript_18991/g.36513 Transcript_18991/m.36513 type:complete len:189 (-) Transcript_18991:820-1386(-)
MFANVCVGVCVCVCVCVLACMFVCVCICACVCFAVPRTYMRAAQFHIVESRENRAKDRNRRTYFTNFQPHRSYSFCLPSLQGLGTMQREVDDRLKTLVEENKVPSHDEGGLRLIRNSIIMDKCIMNAYASPKQSDKMFHRRRKIHHIEALRDYKSPVHRLDQKSHIHRLGGPRGTRSMPGMDAISTST